jgi:predicted NAD/FAD-binding protein|tara:strand:- start:585 stop:1847 length:1263 start_codon:yes stop_codon:yes gene_type:complete
MDIAIIGGGISGISAAWELSKSHHNITIFEKEPKIGGHSNTFEYKDEYGKVWPIDTGFIVFNDWNYPLFQNFLHELNVMAEDSNMSFSFTNDKNNISYAGTLSGLLPNKRSLFTLSQILFLLNIYKYSKKLGALKIPKHQTIIQALTNLGCPKKIIDNYFIPISSAIWSCDSESVSKMPASTFINFFNNHKLFEFFNKPNWKTIKGGSKEYIGRFNSLFKGSIKVNSPVQSIKELDSKVQITLSDNTLQTFDYAIMATHSNIANKLVIDLNSNKKNVLEKYKYTNNDVILHTDKTFMPSNKRTWASWNVISHSQNHSQKYHVTYYMNKLQNILSNIDFFVTINPQTLPGHSKLLFQTTYSHPILSHTYSENEKAIYTLNNSGAIKFCGAYLGYGFHEDGFRSGKLAAQSINNMTGLSNDN